MVLQALQVLELQAQVEQKVLQVLMVLQEFLVQMALQAKTEHQVLQAMALQEQAELMVPLVQTV